MSKIIVRPTSADVAPILVVIVLVLVTTHAWLSREFRPPTSYAGLKVQGSLHTDLVIMDRVQVCGCFTGPSGQAQKKVKMRVENRSGQTLNLGGGKGSSLYLVVDFPTTYTPKIVMPTVQGDEEAVVYQPPTLPAHVPLVHSSGHVELVPQPIEDQALIEDLGIPEGRHAFAIPPNPNQVLESMGPNSATFPTYVETVSLSSGSTYYDPSRGIGDWVFHVPYGPEGEGFASGLGLVDPGSSDSDLYEKYHRVLGVMALGKNGHVLGFSPLPPESSFSHANQF